MTGWFRSSQALTHHQFHYYINSRRVCIKHRMKSHRYYISMGSLPECLKCTQCLARMEALRDQNGNAANLVPGKIQRLAVQAKS